MNKQMTVPGRDSPQLGDMAAGRSRFLRQGTVPVHALTANTQSEPKVQTLHTLLNPAWLQAQRQHQSLEGQLKVAEDDEIEAKKLREKTAELNRMAATMERKLLLALGFHDKKQLPAELRKRCGDDVIPTRVQGLRQEVQAQRAELESLSSRWHTICQVAQQAPKRDGTAEADADVEDLRQELGKLCGKALRYDGLIYVRKKMQHQAKAKSVGLRSPHSTSTEELASTVSEETSPRSLSGQGSRASSRRTSQRKQSLPRPQTLRE